MKKAIIATALICLACLAVSFISENNAEAVRETAVPEGAFVEITTGSGSGVVGAIANLKAYTIEAKKVLAEFNDGEGVAAGNKNSVMEVIEHFGASASSGDLVTEYAKMIGDLKAKHPAHSGLSGYLLDEMNDSILTGKSVVISGLGRNSGFMMLDYKAFGFEYEPEYIKKLRVKITDYSTAQASVHAGKGGKAIAAWEKSGKASAYDRFLAQITAKYMDLQHKEDALQEQGGKIAIQASFKEKSHLNPLPVAGAEGADTVRQSRKFKMPSPKEMAAEALSKAKEYFQTLASANSSIDDIIKQIETTLEGTTIKMTTGSRIMSESGMNPTIKIVGTAGTVTGKIEALPMVGHTLTQTFPSEVDGSNIGDVKRIILEAPDGDTNPWLCTGFEVQVGHGNPWVAFYPHGGKKQFTDGFWLDGSGGKAGPFYRLARQQKWLLLQDNTELEYVKLHAGKMPRCVDMQGGCFTEDDKMDITAMGEKCDAAHKCQGFTYTPGKEKGGEGCLQYRCHSEDTDTDTESRYVENVDYYTKQAFRYKRDALPTECTTACGYAGETFKTAIHCVTVKSSTIVDTENCEAWKPTLPKPKVLTKVCPKTPKCPSLADKPPQVFQNGDTSPVPAEGVTFYKHCVSDGRYAQGYRVTIFGDAPNVATTGMKNDDVSGIYIPHGWQVNVYEHTNYGGKKLYWDACNSKSTHVGCLVNHGFNDKMSSVKISVCDGY